MSKKNVCAPRSSRSNVETPFFYQTSWYVLPRGSRQRIKLIGGTAEEKALWKAGKRFGDGCFQPSDEVRKAFGSWLALREAPRQREAMRVDALCEMYLDAVASRTVKPVEPLTLKLYVRYAKAFCAAFGAMPVSALNPEAVEKWLGKQKTWRSTSVQRKALKVIVQALNWGVKRGMLDRSPLTELELPDDAHRDYLITEEEEAAILQNASPKFAAFFRMAMFCGRRPDEIANIRKDDVVLTPVGLALKLRHHKKAKLTGRPENVWLDATMQQMVRELLDDPTNKTEFLFVKPRSGTQWTCGSWVDAMRHVRTKAKVSDKITLYLCRHAFITRAMMRGVPVNVIASQCGNSVAMIAKHYNQSHHFSAEIMFRAISQATTAVRTEAV